VAGFETNDHVIPPNFTRTTEKRLHLCEPIEYSLRKKVVESLATISGGQEPYRVL
jgi:hypothetical protein